MSFSLDVSIWMVKSPDDRAATANRPSDLRSRRRPFCIVCARTIRSGILLALDRDVTLAGAASGITLKEQRSESVRDERRDMLGHLKLVVCNRFVRPTMQTSLLISQRKRVRDLVTSGLVLANGGDLKMEFR
jgi:hypothetical protein